MSKNKEIKIRKIWKINPRERIREDKIKETQLTINKEDIMRIEFNKSVITEASYHEEYCDICGTFSYAVELKMDDGIDPEEIYYIAICKECLIDLLHNWYKFNKER